MVAATGKTRKIEELLSNGEQPWGPLDAETYEALAADIKANGGKLTVVPVVLSARGRLIDGHHRLMIAQEHGRKVINENEWVVDRKATNAETEALAAIGYQRNRRQTTTADNAKAARDLMRRFNWSQGIVAQKLGVTPAAVSQWFKAHPDPTFVQTERLGADGKTYTVETSEPPKPKQIRQPASAGVEVLKHTNKLLAEITNPELGDWLASFADPDDRAELAMKWQAIAEASERIAERFDDRGDDRPDPFEAEEPAPLEDAPPPSPPASKAPRARRPAGASADGLGAVLDGIAADFNAGVRP